jgi:hypothetical protein
VAAAGDRTEMAAGRDGAKFQWLGGSLGVHRTSVTNNHLNLIPHRIEFWNREQAPGGVTEDVIRRRPATK